MNTYWCFLGKHPNCSICGDLANQKADERKIISFCAKSSSSNNRSKTEGILRINLSMRTNYSAVMDMSLDPSSIMALCFAFKTLEIAAFIFISAKQVYIAAVAALIWWQENRASVVHIHPETHTRRNTLTLRSPFPLWQVSSITLAVHPCLHMLCAGIGE